MAIQFKKIILLPIIFLSAIFAYCLTAKAEEPAKVVTVKMTVERGDVVNKNNLKLVNYNRSKVPADIITNLDDAAGLQTLRTLRPGMHLRYTYLREKPMVAKNKSVKMVYNIPGIKLESQAQALQDGHKGDIVKVKNLKSNKIVNAEVIGENKVQVK